MNNYLTVTILCTQLHSCQPSRILREAPAFDHFPRKFHALTFPPAFWKILPLFPANIKHCKMQIAKLILQLLLLFLIVWYCNCCCFFIVNDNVIEDRYTFFSKLCNCLLIDLFTTSNSYSSKTGVSSFTVVYSLRYKLPHFYFKKLATMQLTYFTTSCLYYPLLSSFISDFTVSSREQSRCQWTGLSGVPEPREQRG